MISLTLTEDQLALKELARRVAAEIYEPVTSVWEADSLPLPAEERRRLAKLDLLGITLPESVGGSNRPLFDALIVIEELAKVSTVAAFAVFEACTGPARVIHLFGSDPQLKRFLPPIVAGESTLALAISEPDAGSAATDITTEGRVKDDLLIINGTKRWCSGAGHAEQYLVYLRVGNVRGAAGIAAAVVDRDSAGVSFGPRERLMGLGGIPSADIFFDDVRIPLDHLIVKPGGFRHLFAAFSIERLGNATMSLAVGQRSLDLARAYVQQRKQFERKLVEFQMVQAALADMLMDVEAARLLIYRAAANAGTGPPSPLEASIAKLFANEMAKRVSDTALQLFGGYGYSTEFGVERLHRDAHGWAIAGGTPNMQRLRIASEYLGRRLSQRPERVERGIDR